MKRKSIKVLIGKILVGVLCAACVMVTGCNRKVTDSNAGEVIKEKLYKKYGKEFEVVEVSRKSDAPFGVPPILGNVSFYAEMYDREQDDTFGASIKRDGSEFKDDYYRYEMEDRLETYIGDILEPVEGIEINYFRGQYFREEGNWIEEEEIEKFLNETETGAILEIEIYAESVEEVPMKCYEVYELLCMNHVEPIIDFIYQEKKIFIPGKYLYEENTKEQLIESFKRELESN